MIEIGRLCIKTAGRDAGLKCVVVDILDNTYVLIDGQTRRRKCNIIHLEPLKDVIKIKKTASQEDIKKEFEKLGLKVWETKSKPKTEKSRRKRKTSEQLRTQKEEKKKLRDILKIRKKEVKPETKEESLEEKAGLAEDKKEENHEHKHGHEEHKKEKKEAKAKKKEGK